MPQASSLSRRLCLPALLLWGALASGAAAQEVGGAGQRAETERFLRDAVSYIDQVGPEQAFAAFNDPQGRFIVGERYVFCNRINGTVLAHGFNPALLGRNLASLRDARGKPFAAALIRIAVTEGQGWLSYEWFNPATRQTEVKDTLIIRVREDIVCGAGHYRR